jgi:pimeloyl-ACP methyl ester carboxylesterase
VVGHDWGSPIAATSALVRPDVFTAVGLLSVPYTPRSSVRPTDAFARAGGDEEFYVSYFQQPGRAEAEIEPDVRSWLRGFYTALAADANVFSIPHGARMRDRFPDAATPLPPWLSKADFDVYAAEFERTGMTGALNRYRNVDRDWEDLAAWDGATIGQPAIYIAGTRDASTAWLAEAIEAQATTLPGLRGSHLLEGGHCVQQERPEDVNRLLIDWLAGKR